MPFIVAVAVVQTMVAVVAPGTVAGAGAGRCDDPAAARASGALDAPVSRFTSVRAANGRVTAATKRIALTIQLDPLAVSASSGDEDIARELPTGGFYFRRGVDAEPIAVATARPGDLEPCGLELDATFADGTVGRVTIQPHAADTVSISLAFDDATITHWGERLVTTPDEAIYGLTERTVDDYGASELEPQAVGTLNRKGEEVRMYVTPTISAYAPYYQSSDGYGLLVDGTMPGRYDLGASDPTRLTFEFELDPQALAARTFVFAGDHYGISDAYSRLTGRPRVPPPIVFLHWRGRDEAVIGPPVEIDGVPVNPTVADDIQHYEEYDIPTGVYHFDRPWAVGTEGYGEFTFDTTRFPDPAAMLRLMRERGWKSTVWISEWALDDRAAEARAQGWLAPGSEREIDLTNRDAVRWLTNDLRRFLTRDEAGKSIDGFFVDRTEEIVPSEADDVFADGRNGRQLHNAYPVLMQRIVRRALDDARGDAGWAIARAAYTGSARYTMTWGGDTRSREGIAAPEQPDGGPSTDLGLRSLLVSLQRAAFLGLPFWGSDIGGYSNFGDREVFARWIEVGAASPLMRFHGKGTDAPWDMPTEPHFDQEVLDIYRNYVRFHHALQPYLVRLSQVAGRTGAPLARPLVYDTPDDPAVADRWDEWKLGPDLLVAPVWQSGARSRPVYLPRGKWVDFWDRETVHDGGKEIVVDAPLGLMPMYVKAGSPLLRDRDLQAVTDAVAAG